MCKLPIAGFMAMLLWVPTVCAQEDADDGNAPPSPTAQVNALTAEFQEEMRKFQLEYRTAVRNLTDPSDRQKLYLERAPKPEKYTAKLLDLIQKHPDDSAAQQAIHWILQYDGENAAVARIYQVVLEKAARDPKNGPYLVLNVLTIADRAQGEVARQAAERMVTLVEVNKDIPGNLASIRYWVTLPQKSQELSDVVTNALVEHCSDRPEFADTCMSLPNRDALRKVIQKTQNDRVRAHAMYGLAILLAGLPVTPDHEAEELLKRIIADHPDVQAGSLGRLGQRAKELLFEMQHLQVGMVAPDIEGVDHENKTFRLTDYRGKLVLLYFWDFSGGSDGARIVTLVDRLTRAKRPFFVVGVNGTSKDYYQSRLDQSRDSLDDWQTWTCFPDAMDNWRSFVDGLNGPIATKWNVTQVPSRWPTVYLLDPQGVIRYKCTQGEKLDVPDLRGRFQYKRPDGEELEQEIERRLLLMGDSSPTSNQ